VIIRLEVIIRMQSVLLKYYIIVFCTQIATLIMLIFFIFECITNVFMLMSPNTVKKTMKNVVTFCLSDVKIHTDQLLRHYEETGKKLPSASED